MILIVCLSLHHAKRSERWSDIAPGFCRAMHCDWGFHFGLLASYEHTPTCLPLSHSGEIFPPECPPSLPRGLVPPLLWPPETRVAASAIGSTGTSPSPRLRLDRCPCRHRPNYPSGIGGPLFGANRSIPVFRISVFIGVTSKSSTWNRCWMCRQCCEQTQRVPAIREWNRNSVRGNARWTVNGIYGEAFPLLFAIRNNLGAGD